MSTHPARPLDRVGAVMGLASVALLLALFTVFPSIPAPNKGIDAIARSVSTDRATHLLAAYVGALLSAVLMVFGVALAARIRRADSGDGWWIVALAGITTAGAIGFVSNALVIVLIRAAGHGVHGDVLWLVYGGDHWLGTLTGIPLGVFLLGVGIGARAAGLLPQWLSWLALALATAFLVGAASVTGDEVDGGPLGLVLLLGYLGLLVWVVAVSVVLWRRSAPSAVPVPSPA